MPKQIPHKKSFSDALNAILDRRGLPSINHGRVDAFAALMGERASSTVHRWVSGQSVPTYPVLLQMADVLACSLDELFGRPSEPETFPSVEVDYFSDTLSGRLLFPQILIDRRNRVGPFGLLRISGHEMAGRLDNNDLAVFDMGQTDIRSGSCFVLELESKLIVRRLRSSMSRKIDVLCENDLFPPETVERTQLVAYDSKLHANEDQKPLILIRGLVIARHRFEH